MRQAHISFKSLSHILRICSCYNLTRIGCFFFFQFSNLGFSFGLLLFQFRNALTGFFQLFRIFFLVSFHFDKKPLCHCALCSFSFLFEFGKIFFELFHELLSVFLFQFRLLFLAHRRLSIFVFSKSRDSQIPKYGSNYFFKHNYALFELIYSFTYASLRNSLTLPRAKSLVPTESIKPFSLASFA